MESNHKVKERLKELNVEIAEIHNKQSKENDRTSKTKLLRLEMELVREKMELLKLEADRVRKVAADVLMKIEADKKLN